MGSDDDDRKHKLGGISHKVTLAAVSSLFGVTIIIILLFLYARYLQNRRLHRRRADFVSRLVSSQIAPATDSDTANPGSHPPHEQHKNSAGGLDPSVMALLPEFLYKPSGRGGGSEVMECSVCLSSIIEDSKIRLLPNCKHVFHLECVDMWLGSNTTCPLCRAAVEPRVQPPEQSGSVLGAGVSSPTAPPIDELSLLHGVEQSSSAAPEKSSGSRLSSFRRMLSRERSSRRSSSEGCVDLAATHHDIERQ